LAELEPGNLVLYQVPQTSVRGRTETGHAANYIFQDRWINRILALPGQQVAWHKGQLLVDGTPSPWQTRLGFGSNDSESFAVPPEHFLIAPGDLVPAGAQLDFASWRRLSVVPRSSIQGRVYFRSLPMGRMSILD
jgi:type IV secretory pathway protease TraF